MQMIDASTQRAAWLTYFNQFEITRPGMSKSQATAQKTIMICLHDLSLRRSHHFSISKQSAQSSYIVILA